MKAQSSTQEGDHQAVADTVDGHNLFDVLWVTEREPGSAWSERLSIRDSLQEIINQVTVAEQFMVMFAPASPFNPKVLLNCMDNLRKVARSCEDRSESATDDACVMLTKTQQTILVFAWD